MKDPVHDLDPEQPPATPTLQFAPRRLSEPDAKFIDDLCVALRAGVRLMSAANWLGCTKTQWKRWKERTGEPYDSMRHRIAEARAHAEVKLQSELARRSPGAALKELQRVRHRDEEPEEPSRPYQQHGLHTLSKMLPNVLSRVENEQIASADLHPLEATAREWREAVIADCGGREILTTAKLSLIHAALGSWILLSSVDAYVMQLVAGNGVVHRKDRKAWPIVEQRARLADSLAKQLQLIGLDKPQPRLLSLEEAIAHEKTKTAKTNGTN